MAEGVCCHCGDLFELSPRHKNQTFCKKIACQKAKKAEWQRRKMKTDSEYRSNQKMSQKKWARSNPDYWKDYRNDNPKKSQEEPLVTDRA